MKKVVLEQLRETFYEERLPNGLLIRVIPRPDFAKTYSFFATDFGSIDTKFTMDGKVYETPAGVAHYLEHKLFDMPDGNVMQQFSALGGSPNAFTGYSMTAYHVESTENWRENLELLLRYVSTPYFTEESVEKERGIIAQEIRMYEDSSGSRMYENLFAALYQHHPIRVPIAGTVESIQDITAQTLYDCHKAFYDPSNMMLCVAGPVNPELVVESARNILPKTPGGVGGRDYGPAEPLTAEKMARVEQNMEVSMPGFTVAFRCDTPKTGADILRQELVGDLAAELLVGESTAFYTKLYEDGLIDCDFSAGYEGVKTLGMLSIGGDSNEPERVVDAVLKEAERLGREGADEALFQRLKRSAFGRRIRELDSFENICYRMCQSTFEGAFYYDFPDLYRSITLDETVRMIRDTVVPQRAALSLIYPNAKG
ncbi:MAG TPA: insulinase family protein [Candidatus Avoscillospira avistercoris]|uniref:Insulinase family protein n=1 Tax=Candidatus Avoscillospira avistercoris TaxID=2840707 RepID=A0A9D1FB75_9FIRM|nr:insulinase family protein [Candidatus Avoscillospira avistercoris]